MENVIRKGMAQAFWMSAWADWQESGECPAEFKVSLSGAKIEEVCGEPNAPQSDIIEEKVDQLVGQLMALNGADVSELFQAACAADKLEGTDEEAEEFGHYLAMQSMGSGVSWFDRHEEFEITVPNQEWSWCDLLWPSTSPETELSAPELSDEAKALFQHLGLDRDDIALLSCTMNGAPVPVVAEVKMEDGLFVLMPRAILLTKDSPLLDALRDPHGRPLPDTNDESGWLNHPDGEGWWWSNYGGESFPTQIIKDDSIPGNVEWHVYELGNESADIYNDLSEIKDGRWRRMIESPPVPPQR